MKMDLAEKWKIWLGEEGGVENCRRKMKVFHQVINLLKIKIKQPKKKQKIANSYIFFVLSIFFWLFSAKSPFNLHFFLGKFSR